MNQQIILHVKDRATADLLAADYRKRGYTAAVVPYGLRLWEVFAELTTAREEAAASTA